MALRLSALRKGLALMTKRQIHLGLSVGSVGYHYAAWRLPEIAADGAMQFSHYRRCAQLA